jgi:hypothetical protein
LPPHPPQLGLPHEAPFGHAAQSVPPTPHTLSDFPGWQVERSQHPPHDVVSQMQSPLAHRCPLPQAPFSQTPPQPSISPHALPAQLGVQPHTPECPPPPHDSGVAHALPRQQGCPAPPQVPQSTPHVCPVAHAAHAAPPPPHEALSFPLAHVLPLQHPAHDVASHLHTPPTQRWP